jgi:osmotically-inducible protein OsmY
MSNQYPQNFQQHPTDRQGRNERFGAEDERRSPWRDESFNRAQNRPAWGEQQGAYGLQRSPRDIYGESGYGQGGQGGGNYDDYYRGEPQQQQGGAAWHQDYQNFGEQERNPQYRGQNQRGGQSAGRDWQQAGAGRSQAYGGGQLGNRQSWSGSQTDFGSSAGEPYGAQPQRDDFGYARGAYQSGQDFQTAGNFRTPLTGHRGKGPKGYTRGDERIREDICECLSDDPHIDASEISVEVKDGVVTLEGTVQERAQKHRVEDIADRCSGVKDVHNGLRVTQQAGQQGGIGQQQGSDKGQDKLGVKAH